MRALPFRMLSNLPFNLIGCKHNILMLSLATGPQRRREAPRRSGPRIIEMPISRSEKNQLWMVTGHREVFEGFKGDLPLTNNRWPQMLVGHLTPEERMARFPYISSSTPHWI